MNIDLTDLHNGRVNEIDITNIYSIPKEYITEDNIIEIDDIKVNGKIFLREFSDDENDLNDYIDCNIEGTIFLKDSISLEPIKYTINIDYSDFIEENCKKNENILDIFTFLWENIVLEVPLHITKVEDLSKYSGDGWKLISEEDSESSNNPFQELLKDYDKE